MTLFLPNHVCLACTPEDAGRCERSWESSHAGLVTRRHYIYTASHKFNPKQLWGVPVRSKGPNRHDAIQRSTTTTYAAFGECGHHSKVYAIRPGQYDCGYGCDRQCLPELLKLLLCRCLSWPERAERPGAFSFLSTITLLNLDPPVPGQLLCGVGSRERQGATEDILWTTATTGSRGMLFRHFGRYSVKTLHIATV